MEELKDIQGLDAVSSWPLAVGWWLVIIATIVCLVVAARYLYKYYLYRKSWQYRSYLNLRDIEVQLINQNTSTLSDLKQLLHKLSTEIRRIAMSTTKRETCAGLVGKQWLEWLQKNDPYSYDWPTHGQLLIEYQYMPETANYDSKQLTSLIDAAKQWVYKC